MNVQVSCEIEGLRRLCQEVLTEYLGNKWNLSSGEVPADLCIWDFSPGSNVPQGSEQISQHLILVHKKDLRKLQERLGQSKAAILLKPVTRATLSAFLGMAIAAHAERTSSMHRRAACDEILQCLIHANLKLQEHDQNRTNFLARAMHDFRVPLTAVNGYCGLLLSGALGRLPENQQEVLLKMQQSSHRLSRMAEAMFQLSTGGHGKGGVSLRKEDIRACLEQCIHEVAITAEGKHISISMDFDPETPALYFDRSLMEQALINLLDNALKFTPRGGQIEVKGYSAFWERRAKHGAMVPIVERRRQNSQEPNGYRIDITNSGKVIAPEHLEEIFAEYASYAGGQDRSGGGLGLAICKMIIVQHEGCVWAENAEKGPRFSFILPARLNTVATSANPRISEMSGESKELTV